MYVLLCADKWVQLGDIDWEDKEIGMGFTIDGTIIIHTCHAISVLSHDTDGHNGTINGAVRYGRRRV